MMLQRKFALEDTTLPLFLTSC